jgi:hypothetical protein
MSLYDNSISLNAPPNYDSLVNTSLSKSEKINNLIKKYEIAPLFSEKLDILCDYDIALLCDDSGSMNTPLDDNSGHSTRWEELKSVVKMVINIATIFDDDGIDIYFLNRENYYNVTSDECISNIFNELPYGSTPLTEKLYNIFQKYKFNEKPVLIIIATDGLPTNNGLLDLYNFNRCVSNKNHNKFYISFLACSDDDCDIEYLNELDRNVPNVDTLDDYNSEKKEVLRIQGADFKYTFSEHIVRLLLGPICLELDSLDEFPIVSNYNYTNKYNCIML